MGRGRAKAKQTRVARDLKYRPMNTDFSALERELRGQEDNESELAERYAEYDNYDDSHSDDSDDDDSADVPSVRFG